jgi:hydroxymethylbilane synthase
MTRELTVATRKSALALTQTRAVMALLLKHNPELSLRELLVTTTGDRVQDRALSELGGKGLFIKEIEEALLDRRADIAVHSMKDVPAELAPSLTIGCVPEREDARDAVVTRTGCRFDELPPKSRVGTSSLRRMVQLSALRPDLEFVPIRGNVDTRLTRCSEGVVEAVVLALAGLKRLGLAERVTERLEPERCLPAIGQGALAIEQRRDDDHVGVWLRTLAHADTSIAVAAERGVMVAVEGSCQLPVAAHAERRGSALLLRALLAEPDGSRVRRKQVSLSWPSSELEARQAGLELGRELKGA